MIRNLYSCSQLTIITIFLSRYSQKASMLARCFRLIKTKTNHRSYFFYEYLHKRINVYMYKCESTHASIYIHIYILYLYIYTYAYMYTCTCKHVMYVYIMCAYLLYIKCLFLLLCESSVCRMRRKRKIDRTNNQTNYRQSKYFRMHRMTNSHSHCSNSANRL